MVREGRSPAVRIDAAGFCRRRFVDKPASIVRADTLFAESGTGFEEPAASAVPFRGLLLDLLGARRAGLHGPRLNEASAWGPFDTRQPIGADPAIPQPVLNDADLEYRHSDLPVTWPVSRHLCGGGSVACQMNPAVISLSRPGRPLGARHQFSARQPRFDPGPHFLYRVERFSAQRHSKRPKLARGQQSEKRRFPDSQHGGDLL